MALTTTSDSRGPNLLAGSSHTGINNLNSTSAGGSVISPVINYNYAVHVPAQESHAPPEAAEIIRALLHFPAPNAARALTSGPSPTTQWAFHAGAGIPEDIEGLEAHSGVFVTELETLPHLPGDTKEIPKIYVRNLLDHGEGLPCFNPRYRGPSTEPESRLVSPGDVGLYTPRDGFRKLYNIWDDQAAIYDTASTLMQTEQLVHLCLPHKQIQRHENHILEGAGMSGGDLTSATFYVPHTKIIDRFEVTCDPSPQGAVLALTSSADLIEMDDSNGLREFLVDYAEVIYQHSRKYRSGRAPKDSLYVITGCVVSQSCGIAAHNRAMTSPNNVLSLENRPITDGPEPQRAWAWTFAGTSMARFHRSNSETGIKDQTLFLRGFKLDFSPEFFASQGKNPGGGRMHAPPASGGGSSSDAPGPSARNEPSSSGTGTVDSASDQVLGGGDWAYSGRRSDFQGPPSVAENGVTVQPFPEESDEHEYHPCNVINKYVLKLTGARIAISHDDDWRMLLKRCPPTKGNSNRELEGRGLRREIYVRHGVAYLLPVGAFSEQKTRHVAGAGLHSRLHDPSHAKKVARAQDELHHTAHWGKARETNIEKSSVDEPLGSLSKSTAPPSASPDISSCKLDVGPTLEYEDLDFPMDSPPVAESKLAEPELSVHPPIVQGTESQHPETWVEFLRNDNFPHIYYNEDPGDFRWTLPSTQAGSDEGRIHRAADNTLLYGQPFHGATGSLAGQEGHSSSYGLASETCYSSASGSVTETLAPSIPEPYSIKKSPGGIEGPTSSQLMLNNMIQRLFGSRVRPIFAFYQTDNSKSPFLVTVSAVHEENSETPKYIGVASAASKEDALEAACQAGLNHLRAMFPELS